MSRKMVRLHECKAGMILASDVFNQFGSVILREGTALDDSLIDKLVVHDIEKIIIEDNGGTQVADKSTAPLIDTLEETKKEYSQKITRIKNIFTNFAEGKDVNEAKEVSLSIVQSDKPKGDLLNCMAQLKSTDEYFYTHSLNVASMCYLIGEWMNLDKNILEELTLAGLLHDVGKTQVPHAILSKTTTLTKSDELEIAKHPVYGYEMLKGKDGASNAVCEGVLYHHEREDGSGYPKGLHGSEINLYSKIIAVADLYSAITIDRVYKRADSPFTVFALFESTASLKFDPVVTYVLLNNIANYYIGDNVKLSNGKSGQIVFIDKEFVSRPIVKCNDGDIIDLKLERNVKVEKMLY